MARPEVTVGAISGHSMGAIGAILAGAADERVAAVVATSSPADPYRLTRQTFRLAHLPIPDPIAYPLAWLTTRVYLRPRGHRVAMVSASTALTAHDRPILLVHGDVDDVVPITHLERLIRTAARSGRRHRVARHRRRPPQLVVRVRGVPAGGRQLPGRGVGRPLQPGRGRRSGRGRAQPADPHWRGDVRGDCGRTRRVPDAGRSRPPEPPTGTATGRRRVRRRPDLSTEAAS